MKRVPRLERHAAQAYAIFIYASTAGQTALVSGRPVSSVGGKPFCGLAVHDGALVVIDHPSEGFNRSLCDVRRKPLLRQTSMRGKSCVRPP